MNLILGDVHIWYSSKSKGLYTNRGGVKEKALKTRKQIKTKKIRHVLAAKTRRKKGMKTNKTKNIEHKLKIKYTEDTHL